MAIDKRIIYIIAEYLDIDESKVHPNSDIGDLGADSLDTIEIILTIEKELDIRIPDDVPTHIETVQDLIDCVDKLV